MVDSSILLAYRRSKHDMGFEMIGILYSLIENFHFLGGWARCRESCFKFFMGLW